MDYTIVEAIQFDKVLQKGLEKASDELEERVNELIDEGYEPIGGITAVKTMFQGREIIELLQPMIKR
jgi:hypothetical protein